MKRPILVAIIGYILGIIVGLYLHISIAPFCIILIAIYMIYKNTNYKNKHQKKKLKMLEFFQVHTLKKMCIAESFLMKLRIINLKITIS